MLFAAGYLSLLLGAPQQSGPPLRGPKSSFEYLGRQALAAGDYERAMDVARQCLAQHRGHKPCEQIAATARSRMLNKLTAALEETPAENLRGRETLLKRLVAANDTPAIRHRLEATVTDIHRVEAAAHDFLQTLETSTDASHDLSVALQPYTPFFPEVQQASEAAAVHRAMRLANRAATENKVQDAIAFVDGVREAAERRRPLATATRASVRESDGVVQRHGHRAVDQRPHRCGNSRSSSRPDGEESRPALYTDGHPIRCADSTGTPTSFQKGRPGCTRKSRHGRDSSYHCS